MFEHVGTPNCKRFWRKAFQKLSDEGVGCIHTNGRVTSPCGTNPWINKYIPLGVFIPTMSEVKGNMEHNDLYVSDVEVLRLHYAKTLNRWYKNLRKNEREIEKIYDGKFCSMWKYYLNSPEVSSRYYQHVVFQF